MSRGATAYLVLATQRSGSTLLVESLRATGIAGNPQEFFERLPATGSIRWIPARRTPRCRLNGAITSALPAAPPTVSVAAS